MYVVVVVVGGNRVVVLLECSQLWCSASKLQKVFLRIARVTPFFSQLQDVSGVGGISVSCTVSDISDCPRTRSGGGGVIIMSPRPALPYPALCLRHNDNYHSQSGW